jgi:O-antigen ligase
MEKGRTSNNILFLFLIAISITSYFVTKIVFVPLALVIALPLAYHFKKYAFIMFIAFSYFRFQEAFPFLMPFKIPKLLALTTLFLVFVDIFINEKLKIKITDDNKIIFYLFAFVPFNVLFSSVPGNSLAYFTSVYVKVLLMALILSFIIRKNSDFKLMNLMIIISGVIISLVALYNKINGIGLVEGTRVTISRELGSILGDPNDLSLIILFPLAFAIASFSTKNSIFNKIYCGVAAVIIISAILATQSRGGLLGVAAIFAVFFNQKIKNKFALVSVGLMVLTILFLFSGIADRSVLNEDPNAAVDASAQSRLDSWTTAIYMGIGNPIFGIGINNFIYEYYFYTEAWDGKYHETHSTWLKALAEGGFTLLILFLMLFYQTAKRIYEIGKILKDSTEYFLINCYNSLFYGIVGFAVSSTFLTQTYTWPIYIIWALSIGLEHIVKEKFNLNEEKGSFKELPKKQKNLKI